MRYLLVLFVASLSLSLPSTGYAFLDFFKKDLDKVPETEEMRAQEAAAKSLVTEALEYEAAGKNDKAFSIYKGVVRKFPVTTSAAMSQYKMGAIQKSRGEYVKAFQSFQIFVDDYKQSSAFDAAVASQYEIAKASQSGEHKEKFIGISRKVQRSEVLEMYQSIIKNAPFSEYAPQAQFAIGEVLENDDKGAEAITAYKKVVASYPKTTLAADAQFRIGEIGNKAIADGSENAANLEASRRAYEDLLISYDNDSRREEAKSRVIEYDELEARKAYDVGRFYEKQKQYKSAALYYRRVAESGGTSAAAEARERLEVVEAKIAGESAGAAASGAATEPKKERKLFGSRLFGRKKRAEREAEEEALRLADGAVEPSNLSPAAMAPEPVEPVEPAADRPPARPIASSAGGSQVAKVVPGGTQLTKRKGYYGPPKPQLALGKKSNNMRLDTSKLQDLPFDLGKLDKKDLEKGLKMIKEELPENLDSADVPEELSTLVDPPNEAVEETELKIPPPPEDE